jgi:hypothetical protein
MKREYPYSKCSFCNLSLSDFCAYLLVASQRSALKLVDLDAELLLKKDSRCPGGILELTQRITLTRRLKKYAGMSNINL